MRNNLMILEISAHVCFLLLFREHSYYTRLGVHSIRLRHRAKGCGPAEEIWVLWTSCNERIGNKLRVCLFAIMIACSRLRRSPVLSYFVENALSAFSTKYDKTFARRSRASTQ